MAPVRIRDLLVSADACDAVVLPTFEPPPHSARRLYASFLDVQEGVALRGIASQRTTFFSDTSGWSSARPGQSNGGYIEDSMDQLGGYAGDAVDEKFYGGGLKPEEAEQIPKPDANDLPYEGPDERSPVRWSWMTSEKEMTKGFPYFLDLYRDNVFKACETFSDDGVCPSDSCFIIDGQCKGCKSLTSESDCNGQPQCQWNTVGEAFCQDKKMIQWVLPQDNDGEGWVELKDIQAKTTSAPYYWDNRHDETTNNRPKNPLCSPVGCAEDERRQGIKDAWIQKRKDSGEKVLESEEERKYGADPEAEKSRYKPKKIPGKIYYRAELG